MNVKTISVILLSLLLFSCQKEKKEFIDKNDSKTEICEDCLKWMVFAKRENGVEFFKSSHFPLLESDSKNMNNKTIQQILYDYNVKFPLDLKNVLLFNDECTDYPSVFNYVHYKDTKEYYKFIFAVTSPPNIKYYEADWFDGTYSNKQKKEILDKFLLINYYCVLIVKVLWEPHLEDLKKRGLNEYYKSEKYIYDSLKTKEQKEYA